jgi:hypothetical protein
LSEIPEFACHSGSDETMERVRQEANERASRSCLYAFSDGRIHFLNSKLDNYKQGEDYGAEGRDKER